MKVSVHSWGGLFAADRQVEIEGCSVTVTDRSRRAESTLDRRSADLLADLAGQVARLPSDAVGPAPETADAGHTDITIADGKLVRHLRLAAGADAPDVVWDLLDAVTAACEPAKGGGPGPSR